MPCLYDIIFFMEANIINIGLIPYGRALGIQKQLLEMRQKGLINDTLLLLEHPPVITLGTRGNYNNIYAEKEELEKNGVEIFEVGRGGDVTYHGPGQIVGYLIFDLNGYNRDVRLFVNKIEQSIINLLKNDYNIAAKSESGKFTGVWADEKKIAAIGISVSSGVTMHGFAFNVNTDLKHFNWINPCGLNRGVTSLSELTGEKQDMKRVYAAVENYFVKEFGITARKQNIKDILGTEAL